MAIFNSYVCLPEGIPDKPEWLEVIGVNYTNLAILRAPYCTSYHRDRIGNPWVPSPVKRLFGFTYKP